MKSMIKIVPPLMALILCAAPALADGQLPEKINMSKLDQAGTAAAFSAASPPTGEDRQLTAQKDDFMKFASVKIREMNSKHILSRARMKIEKGSDGLYRACFHQIDDTTLSCQVNPSQSRSIPYVAVLSYKEQIYAASCATPEECRQGQFKVVDEIPNRHIFVLKNGFWQ